MPTCAYIHAHIFTYNIQYIYVHNSRSLAALRIGSTWSSSERTSTAGTSWNDSRRWSRRVVITLHTLANLKEGTLTYTCWVHLLRASSYTITINSPWRCWMQMQAEFNIVSGIRTSSGSSRASSPRTWGMSCCQRMVKTLTTGGESGRVRNGTRWMSVRR